MSLTFRPVLGFGAALAVVAAGVVTMATFTAPSVSGAAIQMDGRLAGKVVDPQGNPIPGVTVRVENLAMGREVTTETDEDGEYFRRGFRIGRYKIRFEKEGYVPQETEARIGSGMNTVDVTLTPVDLQRAREAARAAGEAYEAGYQAFQSGDYETAVAKMQEVLDNLSADEPGAAEARQAAVRIIGRAQLELDQPEKALERYETLVELQPDDAGVRTELGQAYAQTDQMDKAAEQFRVAVELNPENPDTQYNTGIILIQAGNLDEGIGALQRALELQPQFPLAHKSLGYAQARAGDYRAAVEHMETYLEQQAEAADAAEVQGFIDSLKLEIARQDASKTEGEGGDEGEDESGEGEGGAKDQGRADPLKRQSA